MSFPGCKNEIRAKMKDHKIKIAVTDKREIRAFFNQLRQEFLDWHGTEFESPEFEAQEKKITDFYMSKAIDRIPYIRFHALSIWIPDWLICTSLLMPFVETDVVELEWFACTEVY